MICVFKVHTYFNILYATFFFSHIIYRKFSGKKLPKSEQASFKQFFVITRKYPLCGYFLGVLTHTTAWNRLWDGDEILKCGFKIEYT